MIIKNFKLFEIQYVKRQIPHVNPLQYSVNSRKWSGNKNSIIFVSLKPICKYPQFWNFWKIEQLIWLIFVYQMGYIHNLNKY